MVFARFGWGKPVPVNPNLMTHPRADFLVSAAGPLTNFAIAIVGAMAFRTLRLVIPDLRVAGDLAGFAFNFLGVLVELDLSLGLFNLLPLFPLDGSHMAANLLPLEQAYAFKRFNERHGAQILFFLIVLGMMTPYSPFALVLGPVIETLQRWLMV